MLEDYLKNFEILHNSEAILGSLTLAELSRFERAVGKRGVIFVENYYQKLFKRYFPKMPYVEGRSAKQQFKEVTLYMLSKIKNYYPLNVSVEALRLPTYTWDLSAYEFYEIAAGRVATLALFSFYAQQWKPPRRRGVDVREDLFWAVHYSYHGLPLNNRTPVLLEIIVFLLFLRKEYSALEALLESVEEATFDNLFQSYPKPMRVPWISRDRNSVVPTRFYARHGDVEKVRQRLHRLPKEQHVKHLRHVLQEAAYYGHAVLVEEVFNRLERNKVNGRGEEISREAKGKAFLSAVHRRHMEVVRKFLNHGVDDILEGDKEEALLELVEREELWYRDEIEDLIRSFGKDISLEVKGRILQKIVYCKDAALVFYLLDCGGEEISWKGKSHALLLATSWKPWVVARHDKQELSQQALYRGHAEMVWTLIRRFGKNITKEYRGAILKELVLYGDPALVQFLFNCTEEAFSSRDKSRALKEAVYYGTVEVVQELLKGFRNQISLEDKGEALLGAVTLGPVELAWELMRRFGEDISWQDKGKVLQELSRYEDRVLILYFLSCKGAEISLQDKTKALEKAVSRKAAVSVECFLSCFGKKISAKVLQECLDRALRARAFEIVLRLLEGAEGSISRERQYHVLDGLLGYGVLVAQKKRLAVKIILNIIESMGNAQSFLERVWSRMGIADSTLSLEYKDKVLRWATRYNCVEITSKLLASDGDRLSKWYKATRCREFARVEQEIVFCYTDFLIEEAVKYSKLETLHLLLTYSKKEHPFATTLYALRKAIEYGQSAVVKGLLTMDAHSISVEGKGLALRWAAREGQVDIVECLLAHAGGEISVEDKGVALQEAAYGLYSNSLISNQLLKIVQALLCKRQGQEEISVEDMMLALQKAVRGNVSAVALYLSEYLQGRSVVHQDLEMHMVKDEGLRAFALKRASDGGIVGNRAAFLSKATTVSISM